ncbi:HTH_38 domain-containing protein [Trichonephila clavipes]|nr:HTH_38 domain-containing protein [Trichonephila clavipes]
MSRRKQRSTFDQISEFNRERIVAYRDCGLSFREIGIRIGRNQTTVMRICDRWMQEGTTDRRGDCIHLSAPLHVRTEKSSHDSDGSLSHITNHSKEHCVCNASFSFYAYHSTPFTAEWSVRKTSIAWSTLDAEPQTSPPPIF